MPGEALDHRTKLAHASRRLRSAAAYSVEHELGECRRERGDSADRAGGESLVDERLRPPTKTSRPSTRYGSNRSQGASDTFIPARLGAAARNSSITCRGTA